MEKTGSKSTLRKSQSSITSVNKSKRAETGETTKEKQAKPKSNKMRGECLSESSSHTQFLKKNRYEEVYDRITRDEYFGKQESESSKSFQCIHHGPEGKQYTEKQLLNRKLERELDPIPTDPTWNSECPPAYEWEMIKKLEFLVKDAIDVQQIERLQTHIRDFSKTARDGFKIHILHSVISVLDYLVETYQKQRELKEGLLLLMEIVEKPVVLDQVSDSVKHIKTLRDYIGYLGYLLIRLEEDDLFDYVSRALMWHLSKRKCRRHPREVPSSYTLSVAGPVLYQTVARMLALASDHRFSTFLKLALILSCESTENCIDMMMENIIENIFCRFNPYFPLNDLPIYDTDPVDPQDPNVRLGASSVDTSTTLSLLLVLLKTTNLFLQTNPEYRRELPSPDEYSQRCFVWAYRYECRAREHRHQRNTMSIIVAVILKCFGSRLSFLGTNLMPDVMSISVLTELPSRSDWTGTVSFNTSQLDVQFKKILMQLSVDLMKIFPSNHCFVESRNWLLGLMYLIDPELCYLRANWAPSLFAELRKTALQSIVCILPYIPHHYGKNYGLIRRILWYIEWYSENPYELPVLYWCLRVLQVATYNRQSPQRKESIRDLFDTHGIIILMNLCNTLLDQKHPPVEKSQAIISLVLRLLTSAVEANERVHCCVYPHIKWPSSITTFTNRMLEIILDSLSKNFIISDRWMISFLNFVWEAIIWRDAYREVFLNNNGIYKLLDLITMSRPPVQTLILALVCDVARSGNAVGQLITWRANLVASNTYPIIVKRGVTIATLLASIFRDECGKIGVRLTENGIIEDLEFPLMSTAVRKHLHSEEFCESKWQGKFPSVVVTDLAGSRLSKVFSLLHLLSNDLDYKVSLADEAYRLYKNIELAPEDETILVLCSQYLTIKLNEAWAEVKIQCGKLVPDDNNIIEEFLQIGRGWAKEIQKLQNDVITKDRQKSEKEECTLLEFLARVRLNTALDALREVRCSVRTADREHMTHALLCDAVRAHHRRSLPAVPFNAPVLRTYIPPLDEQNMTGHHVKVDSIPNRGLLQTKNPTKPLRSIRS